MQKNDYTMTSRRYMKYIMCVSLLAHVHGYECV